MNATRAFAAGLLAAHYWAAAPAAAEGLHEVPLSGGWELLPDPGGKLAGAEVSRARSGEGWRVAIVPGCWESAGQPATLTGPVWYAREVDLQDLGADRRLFIRFGAVSYAAEVWASGGRLGEHLGMWDPFTFEVPPEARRGGKLRLAVRVEKPGGRFPLGECFAGFLPYVWGTWGGPWQEVTLRETGPAAIGSLSAIGLAGGDIRVRFDLDLPPGRAADIEVEALVPHPSATTRRVLRETSGGRKEALLHLDVPALWEPAAPHLYQVRVRASVDGAPSDVLERRLGFRDVRTEGERVLVAGKPVHLRGVLHWGWYPGPRAPAPDRKAVLRELEAARSLGFNLVKLCLWVPPPVYLDAADEMGMLLWLELPLWAADLRGPARERVLAEAARIVDAVGDHPSIAVWTAGCEVGSGVDGDLLASLYRMIKDRTGSSLVRDSSGSAECYGGPTPEHADYWDLHPYGDLAFFRPVVDLFAPRWRTPRPWLFGEFCDFEVLRDYPGVVGGAGGAPWWARKDPAANPQGVRWIFGVVDGLAKMERAGLVARREELVEGARRQSLLCRKLVLEATRSCPFISGYVVTGIADTPVSSGGMLDDRGEPRFRPEELRPFNAERVLFAETDRGRRWVAGGDRPRSPDRACVRSGAIVRRHLGLAWDGSGATAGGGARGCLAWSLAPAEAAPLPGRPAPPSPPPSAPAARGEPLASGRLDVGPFAAGPVAEVGDIELRAPAVERPVKLELRVRLELADGPVENRWPLWVFPPIGGPRLRAGLFDPPGALQGEETARALKSAGIDPVPLDEELEPPAGADHPHLAIVTCWRPAFIRKVREGARVLVVLAGSGGFPTVEAPFWREATRVFDDHPSFGDFPHEGWTDLQFYGLAGDRAIDLASARSVLGASLEAPIRRLDVREMDVHAYVLAGDLERGRLLITTLRPQGGLGDEPADLGENVAGLHLLRRWAEWVGGVR